MKDYRHELPYDDGWRQMTGAPVVPFANDYLFRALLQADEKTLRMMVSDLLHMHKEEITEIEITNPIVLGESVDDKEFHLDIRAVMNEETQLNLEMQMSSKEGWIERSMLYACRCFDSLSHGEDYIEAGSVIQISFLNFTLFPKNPEFYATYHMRSDREPYPRYTDKLRISAIDMTRIDLATEEDKVYRIDEWASLFKAASWEEVKMITEQNPEMKQAASSIWQLTEDEKIREQIRRRRANEHYFDMVKGKADRADELEKENAALTSKNETLASEIEVLRQKLAKYESGNPT